MAAPAARVSELSQCWVQSSHAVTVLTGFPNYPTGVVPPEYRSKLRRFFIRQKIHGVRLIRTWLWPQPNHKVLRRVLSFLSFSFSAAMSGLFVSRPDVVIATSPPLLVGLAGWWLARGKRVPFVLEIRDLWPESLTAVGLGDSRSPLQLVLTELASFLYRVSDKIVVVSPAFKAHLVENWHVSAEKISVVQNGVETDLFKPGLETSSLKDKLQAQEKFIVSYMGTIGMAHGLETLIETAKQIQGSHPNILFLVIGEGAEKERIVAMAQSLALSNLLILGQQPRETVPAYICASNACIAMLKNDPLFKTVIPSKMLEFMACARPVILGVDGQARKILEDGRAGIFVQPGNVDALARAIIQLACDAGLCDSLGNSGRRYILRHNTRKQTADRYIEVLENISP
jgi:glycosyltransferase involved in cell wall biosynthesis